MVSLATATVIFESELYLLFGDLCLSSPSRSVPEFFPAITGETGVEPGTKSRHTLSQAEKIS